MGVIVSKSPLRKVEHQTFRWPTSVWLNGVPWDTHRESIRRNEEPKLFLPTGVDLSTARIVSRKGRDLATMWSDKVAVGVRFADNPNGADDYKLEISFGR